MNFCSGFLFLCAFLGVLGPRANKVPALVFKSRFIGLYFTVFAVFSECSCDASKGAVPLISVAHSPIYFPSSLTFMNSGTVGPTVPEL